MVEEEEEDWVWCMEAHSLLLVFKLMSVNPVKLAYDQRQPCSSQRL